VSACAPERCLSSPILVPRESPRPSGLLRNRCVDASARRTGTGTREAVGDQPLVAIAPGRAGQRGRDERSSTWQLPLPPTELRQQHRRCDRHLGGTTSNAPRAFRGTGASRGTSIICCEVPRFRMPSEGWMRSRRRHAVGAGRLPLEFWDSREGASFLWEPR
jgi:hypothetical protein